MNKKYSSLEDGEVREEEDEEDSDYQFVQRANGVSDSDILKDGEEDFFYGGGRQGEQAFEHIEEH